MQAITCAPVPERYPNMELAMRANLASVFTQTPFWKPEFSNIRGAESMFPEDQRQARAAEIAALQAEIDASTLDGVALMESLQSWVVAQCDERHFVCAICGRRSIVSLTDLRIYIGNRTGICMCCVAMPGVPTAILQDHPVVEVFAGMCGREIATRFPGCKVQMIFNRTICGRDGNSTRPDVSLFVEFAGMHITLLIEVDADKKSWDAMATKDGGLLRESYAIFKDTTNIVSAVLRFKTALVDNVFPTHLYLSLWQVIERFVLYMWNDEHAADRTQTTRVFINYATGYYNKLGVRLQCTNKWGSDVMKPLMQQDAGNQVDFSVDQFELSPKTRTSSFALMREKAFAYIVLRDIGTNPYIAVYRHGKFHLGEIQGTTFLAAAQSPDDTTVRYFNGFKAYMPQAANLNPDSIRTGKYLLVKHVLVTRYLDALRGIAEDDAERVVRCNRTQASMQARLGRVLMQMRL